MEKSFILVIITITTGLIVADEISPDEQEVSSKEGESVTLRCSYRATSENIYLYWYRQHSNQAPQYLLLKGARSNTYENIPDKRFKSTTSRDSTQLTIDSLTIADTAIYYCALRTGGYWGLEYRASDKLTFAKGTTLTVYAKEPKISVLSLLFPSKETELDVCVATGGVQRDQEMTLRTTEVEAKKVKTIDGAMYSLGNANYFAAFDNNITTCDMGGQQDSRRKSEDSTESNKQDAPRPSALPCPEGDDANTHTTHTNDGPKVNFRMLTINSIRVLLAKAVAFDILVTVKAMFF